MGFSNGFVAASMAIISVSADPKNLGATLGMGQTALIVGANGTVNIGGVNTDTPNNTVGIYNPTYFKGTNQSNVTEVQVRYVDGDDSFAFGKRISALPSVISTPIRRSSSRIMIALTPF